MAIFGYNVAGSTGEMPSGVKGSLFTLPEDGQVTSISVYVYDFGAGNEQIHAAIYRHSDLALLGVTQTGNVPTSPGWVTLNFATPVSLPAGDYVLAAQGTMNLGMWSYYYDTGDTDQGHCSGDGWPTFPDPLSPWHNNYKFSIYATYTPSGSTYKISGTIRDGQSTPLPGVTVNLTGGAQASTETNESGYYEFTGLSPGDYTVTPSKQGWSFDPDHRDVTVVNSDVTGQDFTGTELATYAISGRVTEQGSGAPETGVQVQADGHSGQTNEQGYYQITGLSPGQYTVTPSKSGRAFTPASRSVEIVSADVTGQDFEAYSAPGPRTACSFDAASGKPELDILGSVRLIYRPSYGVAATQALSAVAESSYAAREYASDATPPTVEILAPTESEEVSGDVEVRVSATDDVAVASVRYYVDGNLKQQQAGHQEALYTWAWDARPWANGPHTLLVVAVDTAGNEGSDQVQVEVNNSLANETRVLYTRRLPDDAPDPDKWRLDAGHLPDLGVFTAEVGEVPGLPQYRYNVQVYYHRPGDTLDLARYQVVTPDTVHRLVGTGASVRWALKAQPQVVWAHWEAPDRQAFTRLVPVPGGEVLVLAEPPALYKLTSSGFGLWAEPAVSAVTDLAVAGDKVFLASGWDLVAVDLDDGQELTFDIDLPGATAVDALAADSGGVLYVAVNTEQGPVVYQFVYEALMRVCTLPARAQCLLVSGSTLWVGGRDGHVYSVTRGVVTDAYSTGEAVVNRLYDDSGVLWALTGTGGKLFRSSPTWQVDNTFDLGNLRGAAVYQGSLWLSGEGNGLWECRDTGWSQAYQLAQVTAIGDLYSDGQCLLLATAHEQGARLYRLEIAAPGAFVCGPQPPAFYAGLVRYDL